MANSGYTKQICVDYGVDERKIQVVYPGVDREFERGPKVESIIQKHGLSGKFVMMTVGRLVKRKGHDMVIQALPSILDRVPDAIYLIVGDGPERQALEQAAERAGVREHVVFAGSVGDSEILRQYYQTADTFVMTSRILEKKGDVEGFGIVYLEAASCGLTAVAGRSGGVVDAVIDQETGLLVDPTSLQEIADAVVRLHDDPALRERLGQAAYMRAKSSFQYDQVVQKMDAFIDTVCVMKNK